MENLCRNLYHFCNCSTYIYILFVGSPKWWNVLLKHVPSLAEKLLCNTSWESRTKSVTTISFQAIEVRSDLFELPHVYDVDLLHLASLCASTWYNYLS
jgi:hypothetical protein